MREFFFKSEISFLKSLGEIALLKGLGLLLLVRLGRDSLRLLLLNLGAVLTIRSLGSKGVVVG